MLSIILGKRMQKQKQINNQIRQLGDDLGKKHIPNSPVSPSIIKPKPGENIKGDIKKVPIK